MPKLIPILEEQAIGVFTNADLDDLPEGYCSQLRNLRAWNGRLIKTFGIGAKIATALANSIDTLAVLVSDYLTTPTGYRYFGIYVHSTTFVVIIYFWDTSGAGAWTSLLSGTYYHKNERNPIINTEDCIRFLPGNVSKADGTNESKGIWYGYIGRNFFDGLYLPATYTAGFKEYACNIDPPALTITPTQLSYGSFAADEKWYRFSYIYDGVQESLLSAGSLYVNVSASKIVQLSFSITKTAHNKRITGLKIYRADAAAGTYKDIMTVDLIRPSADILSGTTNAYNGGYVVYIPGLTGYTFDNTTYDYAIEIGTAKYEIVDTVTGAGNVLFALRSSVSHGGDPTAAAYPVLDADKTFNGAWTLHYWLTDQYVTTGQSGTTGCYAGQDVCVLPNLYDKDTLTGGMLKFSTDIRIILQSNQRAVQFADNLLITGVTAQTWKVMQAGKGFYYVTDGTAVTYYVFDNEWTANAEHPLIGTESIKINGRFAKIIAGRLWQLNLVLDPGGKGEIRKNWLSYSESGQCDVTPLGNCLKITDQEDSEPMGIAEMYGNPIILYERSTFVVDIKTDPTDPTTWQVLESIHNIGNISHQGFINIMDMLYMCSHDGVYRLAPNNLAESDHTPTERLKISDPINDVYEGLTQAQREGIIVLYDKDYGELVCNFGGGRYTDDVTSGATFTSDDEGNGDADDAFDDSLLTFWMTSWGNDSAYIQVQFSAAKEIAKYTITSRESPLHLYCSPYTWKLYGANTPTGNPPGNGWTELDSQSAITWMPKEQKEFIIATGSVASYTYYRLVISDIYNGHWTPPPPEYAYDAVSVMEIEMMEIAPANVWAYNVLKDRWREIDTSVYADLMALDEYANVLVYDSSDKKIYSLAEDESVEISFKSKRFVVDMNRDVPVRYLHASYKSASDLTAKVYVNNESQSSVDVTLPAQGSMDLLKIKLGVRAQKLILEIMDDTESTTETEIGGLWIEVD